ncbi:alpha/beta hydrolase [Amnibacterium sp.]|uniref:alpha/beta fold hydrolase n=1 Tax=Amnibacterium sp. TaxID=1872496 RepID=UPI002613A2EB|nr:alpha/beta hydrolase [Amnibacterium sp.]MCU1473756.1 bphD [Amnibacterium sp.]
MPVPLQTDPAALGLRRRIVGTAAGPLLVHAGRPAGGPATILLPGAAGSWTTWTPLLAASDRTPAPLRDVIAVDLPGWGGSPGPVPQVEVLATAIEQVAEDAGHRSWRLLGHSLGGFAALDLAARRPDAVLGVGLVSPTASAVVAAVRSPIRGGARLPWFAGMLLGMRTLARLPGGGRPLVGGLHRLGVLGTLAAPLFASRPDPSVIEALADEVRPGAFVAACREAAGYDLGRWRRIRCPVRSVRGGHDVFTGAHDGAALARLIPDFAETVLEGAGHFAAVEQPDAVLAALAPILRP